MSHITSVLAHTTQPPFHIVRAAHAELRVTDLDASAAFYETALGLIVTDRTPDALHLRAWEERHHHSLVLRRADEPAVDHLGFRVGSEEDLDRAAAALQEHGIDARWVVDGQAHGRALRFADPIGFPIELFYDMPTVPPGTQRYDLQRGAPILRFDHFNVHVPDVDQALRFWLSLGFRCSEYIAGEGDDSPLTGAWLSRKPTVHDLAFTIGRGPRLHHIGLYVGEPNGILRACDQLAAAGFAASIERGPGRHGVSNAFFVYLRDPDGHRVELYSSDYYTGDPDLEPIRWNVKDPRCRSFWGAHTPDSWYDESSTVLGLDGQPLETERPVTDERSEVMA